MTDDNVRGERAVSRIVLGIVIAAAGILFTLDNLGLLEHAETYVETYWPLALIAIGLAQLIQTRTWRGYVWSLVLIFAGGWMVAYNLNYAPVSIWTLSPLILVALGVSIMWRGYRSPALLRGVPANNNSFINGMAVMGGFERASDSPDFRGADLLAIMGGCKVDLRHATIAADQAVIDVTAIMGGIELRIPENWRVDAHVLPLMGGLSDQTHRSPGLESPQRLVVRGTAFMGGVEIKN